MSLFESVCALWDTLNIYFNILEHVRGLLWIFWSIFAVHFSIMEPMLSSFVSKTLKLHEMSIHFRQFKVSGVDFGWPPQLGGGDHQNVKK